MTLSDVLDKGFNGWEVRFGYRAKGFENRCFTLTPHWRGGTMRSGEEEIFFFQSQRKAPEGLTNPLEIMIPKNAS
jgi:hypothetical protein